MTAAVAADGWQQALELSGEMLAAAGQGEWDKATALQAACDSRLRQLAVEPVGLDALRQLQQDHHAVQALAAAARDTVADALGRHRTNHRAVSAYLTSVERD